MPKRIFQKLLPNPAIIKNNKSFQVLGDHIHSPNLWHLNRKSTSKAVFIGIFCAFLPIPLQMLLAAVLAILFTANLPLSTVVVWISNPFTYAPMYYSCYKVGSVLLGESETPFHIELSFDWLIHDFPNFWKPLFTGSLVLGVFCATSGYLATQSYWRSIVLKKWQARANRRKNKS